MLKNKLFTYFLLIMLNILFTHAACAAPSQDPVALLKYIADNMIAGLKQNKATLKTKPQVVYNLAYRYVVPYADLPTMSKRVLPPTTWNSATSAERAQFQQAFTTTVIRTYASALSSYEDQTVKFYPVRGGYQNLQTVVVNGEIQSDNSSIQVSYRLIRVGSNWRLYDMSVEGVSLIESFRSQFGSILEEGNISTLLQRMSAHNGVSRG